jgi:hypothetical protein
VSVNKNNYNILTSNPLESSEPRASLESSKSDFLSLVGTSVEFSTHLSYIIVIVIPLFYTTLGFWGFGVLGF